MAVLPLTNGRVALIDDEDDTGLKWYFEKSTGYTARKLPGKGGKTYLHRFVMERVLKRKLKKGEYVDHINRKKWDDRRSNLRVATMSQNLVNRTIDYRSTSGIRGVTEDKRNGRWVAYYFVKSKKKHIGSFGTKEEALAARMEVVIKIYGEFYRPD